MPKMWANIMGKRSRYRAMPSLQRTTKVIYIKHGMREIFLGLDTLTKDINTDFDVVISYMEALDYLKLRDTWYKTHPEEKENVLDNIKKRVILRKL